MEDNRPKLPLSTSFPRIFNLTNNLSEAANCSSVTQRCSNIHLCVLFPVPSKRQYRI